MHDVLEINDIRQLKQFRAVWWSLLTKTSDASFFQTAEWLEVYWKHFGREQTLRILIVGDPERPIGILPLVIRSEQRKVGQVRVLTYPLDDWGSFYGPVSDQPVETLLAGLSHIRETNQNWDMIDIRWVPECGIDPAETDQIMQLTELYPCCSIRAETAIVELEGTWEEYLSKRTGKWRNNYRRWHRRLQEAGEVRYERYRPLGEAHDDDDPRWDLYDVCEQLVSNSWQGSSKDGTTLSHESVREFLRAAHETATRLGCLDLNLLYLDDRPIAFAYNYHFQGRIFGLRIGYEPEMSAVSPGNMIYTFAIEDSFRRGDQVYDLGPGTLDRKRHFYSRTASIAQYTYYRPRVLRAQLLMLKSRLQDWWLGG